jgi:hypothetical protein
LNYQFLPSDLHELNNQDIYQMMEDLDINHTNECLH